MISLTPLYIRRRLLDMNTLTPETFGFLTVRLFISRTAVRWTVSHGQVTTVFRYPRYDYDDEFVDSVGQLEVRDEALSEAANHIMATYEQPAPAEMKYCANCGRPVTTYRARYCSASCRVHAYQKRQKAKAS